ncbi:hypothetical protein BZA77DRAFT_289690 [Pyronema omphalodes]|nr:hypothetical protein BZA77DRAFT_289690 [Pyronema omphalodes]
MVDDMPTTPQSMCDSRSSYASTPEPFAPATPASSMASPSPMSFDDEVNIKKEGGETKPPAKKRKSWGQQLPTPTTNLPPRKRAKTAEEKEQRRVERVLRNRAAAQKSREVKKQQMETIESERDQLKQTAEELMERVRQLEARLAQYENIANTESLARPVSTFLFDQEMHLQTPNTLSTTIRLQDLDQSLGNTPASTMAFEESSKSFCMTQQPAALLCDLPCLQKDTTSSVTWATVLRWMGSLGGSVTSLSPTTQISRILPTLTLALPSLL